MNIPPYTEEELRGVIVKALTEREGKSKGLAKYMAEKVIRNLRSRDPRDAVRLARMCRSREEVDELAWIMRKYRH